MTLAQTDLYTKLETNASLLIKASLAVILGLMLVLSVYSATESFGQEDKDKVKEDRKEAKKEDRKEAKKEDRKEAKKEDRKEAKKETKDKVKEDTGHTGNIEQYVNELQHRADRLQKTAEDQGSNEALAIIQQAMDLIMKAKEMISQDNYDAAKPLLRDANDMLNKAGMMLKGDSDVSGVPEQDYTSKIENFANELEHRANMLKKAAEDQNNNEALAVIQQAMDLINQAKQMVSEKNYDGAKPLLRDANDMLNKAGMMLKGDSDANPVPGKEAQAPYYPPQPPANGNRPNMHSISSLVGVGTANEGSEGKTADVFAELELSVFRATPNMVSLRVTDGIITVGDIIYTVDQGKVVMAMKAHKMILIAKLSSDDATETLTLKLFGSMPNSPADSKDNPPPGMHTIMLRGKLAQMFINIDAEVT